MSQDKNSNAEEYERSNRVRESHPSSTLAEDRRVSDADRAEPVTEAEREHGSGKFGRLAGPRPPAPEERVDTPVMGVVPPEPNTPDEAGEIDLMRGDPRRVREAPRGSSANDHEAAEEARRRARYEEGATEVSDM